MTLYPEVVGRSCDRCAEFMFQDNGDRMGDLITLGDGRPMRRPRGVGTPCHRCPKVPPDAPGGRVRANAIEPTRRSLDALAHYRKCAAVGRFPDDPVVEENAAVIAMIDRFVADARSESVSGVLARIFSSR